MGTPVRHQAQGNSVSGVQTIMTNSKPQAFKSQTLENQRRRHRPTHRRQSALVLGTLMAAASMGAATARAEGGAAQPGYRYDFEADFVDAEILTGDGPRLVVRPRAVRTTLIRTRTSFVVPLLHSVEEL